MVPKYLMERTIMMKSNEQDIYIIEVKIFENTLCQTFKTLNSSTQNDLVT